MSGSDNKAAALRVTDETDALDEREQPLRETDAAETRMTYDHGKLPWLIGVMWVGFLIGFGIYVVRYLVPSLAQWGSP